MRTLAARSIPPAIPPRTTSAVMTRKRAVSPTAGPALPMKLPKISLLAAASTSGPKVPVRAIQV